MKCKMSWNADAGAGSMTPSRNNYVAHVTHDDDDDDDYDDDDDDDDDDDHDDDD